MASASLFSPIRAAGAQSTASVGTVLDRVQDHLSAVLNPALKVLQPTLRGLLSSSTVQTFLQSLVTPPTWILVGTSPGAPAFGVNFGNVGSGFALTAFLKDPLGYVHLKANVLAGGSIAANAAIFTLPAGYRPKEQHEFAARLWNTSAFSATFIDISAAGTVSCESAFSINYNVFIEAIFLAEQ